MLKPLCRDDSDEIKLCAQKIIAKLIHGLRGMMNHEFWRRQEEKAYKQHQDVEQAMSDYYIGEDDSCDLFVTRLPSDDLLDR